MDLIPPKVLTEYFTVSSNATTCPVSTVSFSPG
ncbi:phage lambda Rz1-like protein [Thermosipho sp. 1063]|nr:phage lambda Rz1-like protein [Thermosipho sp. 1063]